MFYMRLRGDGMGKVIALAVLCLILAVLCFIAACAKIWKTYDIDFDEWEEDEKDDA